MMQKIQIKSTQNVDNSTDLTNWSNVISKEPAWLTEKRRHAKNVFEALQLERSPYTQLKLDFQNFRPTSISNISLKPVTDNRIESVVYQKRGLICENLIKALEKYPDTIKSFWSTIQNPEEDKLLAANHAFSNNGIFILVPEGLEVIYPLKCIIHINKDQRIFTKNIIVLEPNTKLKLIIEIDGNNLTERMPVALKMQKTDSEAISILSESMEIFLGDNSQLDIATIQKAGNSKFISHRSAQCKKNSQLRWITCTLGGSLAKTKRKTFLAGEGAIVEDLEIFLGSDKQHFDTSSTIFHNAPNTKSNAHINGILKDRARWVSQGLINIAKNAACSDSFLGEHALMLDKGCRADAIPSLEIETSNVKAGHSASTSQIDPEQLFYLISRGYSKESAKKAIGLGFLEPTIAKIADKEIQEEVKNLLDAKWNLQ